MNNKEKNIYDIYKVLWEYANKLEKLKAINIFDVDMLLSSLHHQVDQLLFFYRDLIPKSASKNANDTYYHLKREPKEHQLIYVNLGRGYPKELFDPHWCYVLKHCGIKLLVIPTTSLKETSSTENRIYYFDITQEDEVQSRLRFDEIRVIDKMRIVEKKDYKCIKTDRLDIEKRLMCFLGLFKPELVENGNIEKKC